MGFHSPLLIRPAIYLGGKRGLGGGTLDSHDIKKLLGMSRLKLINGERINGPMGYFTYAYKRGNYIGVIT